MLPKLHLFLYLSVLSNVASFTLPAILSMIVRRECKTPGIVDVRVLFDDAVAVESLLKRANPFTNCTGAIVLERLLSNVSFGQHFRKSRVNVVHITNLTEGNVQQIGVYIKHSAYYDWGAKYFFHLPSLSTNQMNNFTAIATTLSGNRLYNNLFAVNNEHFFTFNVLNGAIRSHALMREAVKVLLQNKFQQMHRYYLEDLVTAEMFPFHFIHYRNGKKKIYNREAYMITMLADRINLSMVERTDQTNMVLLHQIEDRIKENSIIATYGHIEGDFRRIYTNEVEGYCLVTRAVTISTILDDFIDPFDWYVWSLWLVCSELTAMIWTFVKCVQSPSSKSPFAWFCEYGGLHLVLLQCCVLAPPNLKKIRKIEKLLLFCYILAVFHLVTVYMSIVISNLSTLRYHGYLKTMQDLIRHNSLIVGTESQQKILGYKVNRNFNKKEESMAVVLGCSSARLMEHHAPMEFQITGTPFMSYYIVYLLHKESILQEMLERFVALTYQADLYRYWDNFIEHFDQTHRDQLALTARVIKFEDIVWLFVLIPGGGMLGLIALLLELVYYRLTKKLEF